MKLTNLFCLSFAFAAVGSSASFYFFSDPVHAAVSLPQKAVLVREAGTTLAVADYRSDAAFDRVVVGSQQALRDAVQEGNWQTDSTVLRTPETPQDKLRRTSAEQATTQNRAKHSTRGVTPEAGDNDGRTMGVLVERMPTTQTESFIPEPQEGSAIPMYVSRLGVAPARSGQRNQPPVTDKLSAGELKPAVFPAVMVPPSSETGMTSLQLAEWRKLEQTFVTDIGGPNQSLSDPAYRARWQSAQEISDAMFRQKFGTEAFLRYNAEAGRRNE